MGGEVKGWNPGRILIGYDASEGAEDAVALAGNLCGADARFLLAHILPFPGPPPVAGELLGYQEAAEWKVFFAEAAKKLGRERVEHEVWVGGSSGTPAGRSAANSLRSTGTTCSPRMSSCSRTVVSGRPAWSMRNSCRW